MADASMADAMEMERESCEAAGEVRWGIIGHLLIKHRCAGASSAAATSANASADDIRRGFKDYRSGPAFQLASRSKLVAVMRRDGAKAKEFAERHKVRLCKDCRSEIGACVVRLSGGFAGGPASERGLRGHAPRIAPVSLCAFTQ